MTAFVARTKPFSDFLLVLPPEQQGAATAPERGLDREPRCIFLSGIVEVDGHLLSAAAEVTQRLRTGALTPQSLASARGQFTAIIEVGSDLFVINDVFGFEHTYLLTGGPRRVVSNRLASVIEYMKREGISRRPNYGVIAAGLFTRHHFFRQIHSHDLHVEGIELIPVDQFLRIDASDRISRLEKTSLRSALEPSDQANYDALMDAAAEEIVGSIRAAWEFPDFAQKWIDLSGGYDSRLTLAAAIRGDVLDDLRAFSKDVAGSDDLKVAMSIAQWAGCRLVDCDVRPGYARSATFNFMLWRSFNCGLYHAMKLGVLGGSSALGSHFGSLRLTGGCGEVYSTFWLKAFPAIARRSGPLEDLFFQVKGVSRIPEPFRTSAWTTFSQSISDLPGRDLAERLENHYLFFRNRAHFGQCGFAAFHGSLPWAPLVSASLLAASRLVGLDARENGQVKLDLFSRTAPALAFFDFNDGKRWPDRMLRRIAGHEELRRAVRGVGDASAKIEEWKTSQKKLSTFRKGQRRRLDPALSPERKLAFVRAELIKALDHMRQADHRMTLLLPPLIERWFDSAVISSPSHALHLASKVMGIYDCCFDEEAASLSLAALPLSEEYDHANPLAGVKRIERPGSASSDVPRREE